MEPLEPRQALASAFDLVGIVFLARLQSRLGADEFRVHVLGTGDADGADGGPAVRVDGNSDVHGVGPVVGDDFAVGDRRLGVALLPPALEQALLGTGDDGGAGHLAAGEAVILRALDLVVGAGGRRAVGDGDGAEAEQRPGIDHDANRGRVRQVGIGGKPGRFHAVDKDVDGTAVIALAVKGAGDAAVVAAGLGQQSGGEHHTRVGSIGAARDSGDNDISMVQLEGIAVERACRRVRGQRGTFGASGETA